MVGFQASARGGIVHVRVAGGRVLQGGKAVTIVLGELLVRVVSSISFGHIVHGTNQRETLGIEKWQIG